MQTALGLSIGMVSLLILLLLFRWLLARAWGIICKSGPVFGETVQVRLVALGVAAFLCPGLLRGPLNALSNAIQTLISLGGNVVISFLNYSNASNRSDAVALLAPVVANLSNTLGSVLRALSFPITPFFLGLACWIFIGQLLSNSSQSLTLARIYNYRHAISASAWINVALFAVLLAGSYFSIAAITAIPSLQASEVPIEADKARLTQQLQQLKSYDNRQKFDQQFQYPDTAALSQLDSFLGSQSTSAAKSTAIPPTPNQSPQSQPAGPIKLSTPSSSAVGALQQSSTGSFSRNEQSSGSSTIGQAGITTSRSGGDSSDAPPLAEVLKQHPELEASVNRLKEWNEEQKTTDNMLRNSLSTLRDQIYSKEEHAFTVTSDRFDTGTAGKMGTRERSLFIRELDTDYQGYSEYLDNILRNNISDMSLYQAFWAARKAAIIGTFKRFTNVAKTIDPIEIGEIDYLLTSPPYDASDLSAKVTLSDIVFTPVPNEFDDWGFFRYFAGWLLTANSLALASITGMIGTGLLGSAASSFIRQQKERQEGAPLVNDLSGIVIRGFSAAIVIFLAVEGGLNIFGATNGTPNPYVLLCTCLVGAVYSEVVWGKAQQWLTNAQARPAGSDVHSADKLPSQDL